MFYRVVRIRVFCIDEHPLLLVWDQAVASEAVCPRVFSSLIVGACAYFQSFSLACALPPIVCRSEESFNEAQDCLDSIDEDVALVLKRIRSPSPTTSSLLYRSHVRPYTLAFLSALTCALCACMHALITCRNIQHEKRVRDAAILSQSSAGLTGALKVLSDRCGHPIHGACTHKSVVNRYALQYMYQCGSVVQKVLAHVFAHLPSTSGIIMCGSETPSTPSMSK